MSATSEATTHHYPHPIQVPFKHSVLWQHGCHPLLNPQGGDQGACPTEASGGTAQESSYAGTLESMICRLG